MRPFIVDDGVDQVLVWANTGLGAMAKCFSEHPSMKGYSEVKVIALTGVRPPRANGGLETRETVLAKATEILTEQGTEASM